LKRPVGFLAAAILLALSPSALADAAGSWPDVAAPAAVAADGAKDAAVIVGIDEYAFVAHVPGATRNAADWLTFLTESRKIPIDRVQLLRDVQGTREGILKAASQAAKQVQPGGTLWFVFIGHGAPSANGSDGLLVGADAQQSADSIFARSVAQGEVLSRLAASPASAHRVLVVDACFSGRTGSGEALAAGLQPMLAVHEAAVAGATVLSAGGSDQFAGPLPGSGRPAFSYLVLGALRGWAAEPSGDVTANDAVAYARLVLRTLPLGRLQEPRLSGATPGFVLARHATEAPPNLHDMLLHGSEPSPGPAASGSTPAIPAPVARDEGPRLPGAIHASFSAPMGDTGIWSFQDADHKTLCKLPCTRWMVPGPGYVLVRESPIKGEAELRIPVPAESPFKEGSDVNEQIIAPRGSLTAGIVTTSISAVAAGVGTFLTIDGFGSASNASSSTVWEGTGGVTLITLGVIGVIVGIPMMAVSHSWRVDQSPGTQGPFMFHFSPQGLELTRGKTRVALSPSGVGGVF
jgi:hypothetical protein